MTLLRTCLLGSLAAALLLGLPGTATALSIHGHGPPDGIPASDQGNGPPDEVPASDQGLEHGFAFGDEAPPDLSVPVVDPQDGTNGDHTPGPPNPFPAHPGVPISIEHFEGGFMISISHPNADKLGFSDPFVSLQIRPGSGPDTVSFLARPPTTIPEPSTLALALFGIAGLLGLSSRRWVRS